MNQRLFDFYDYIGVEPYDAGEEEVEFYLRCCDAGMHYADADRYAICNTLFQYDIGMENAMLIDSWMYANDEEIYELTYRDKELFEKACEELMIDLDFSNFLDKDFEVYMYYEAK